MYEFSRTRVCVSLPRSFLLIDFFHKAGTHRCHVDSLGALQYRQNG